MENKWENIVIQKPLQTLNQKLKQKAEALPPRVKISPYAGNSWLTKEILQSNHDHLKKTAFNQKQALHGRIPGQSTPANPESVIQTFITPPKSAFNYQPWRTPMQKKTKNLQEENEKLQKKVDKEKKETIKPNKIFIGIKKTPRKR